jgi:hypothetical protein
MLNDCFVIVDSGTALNLNGAVSGGLLTMVIKAASFA